VSAPAARRATLPPVAVALDFAVPVIDPYGSVFRLLRGAELPFSLFRVEDPSEVSGDAPFAILGSYGKPDAAAVGELAARVPTVVYAVQVRASDPAPLMRASGYVNDHMPAGLVRDVILSALAKIVVRAERA
jgi:hypothetical protein